MIPSKSTSTPTEVKFADSASLDAFGRLRVSNPATLFDSSFQYDLRQVYWQEDTAGSATVAEVSNQSSARLTVTASASDSAVMQTRDYFRYQPGKSLAITMTGVFGAATAGVVKRMGYFDAENGLFLEQNGTTDVAFVRRTYTSGTAVNNRYVQTAWNIDKFDGTGASGITLDLTKGQIFFVDLQWLSLGRVRYGFEVNGILYYCHEYNAANELDVAYMTSANLPVRYEITSDGTNGDSMDAICQTVQSEGGFSVGSYFPCSVDTLSSGSVSVGTTLVPLLSIRPKATFNSVTNRGLIFPQSVNFLNTDNTKYVAVRLIYGGTISGGAGTWTSASADSVVEYNTDHTAISGGIQTEAMFAEASISASVGQDHRLPLALDISGSHPTSPYTDILTVAALTSTGNASCYAAINWGEIR